MTHFFISSKKGNKYNMQAMPPPTAKTRTIHLVDAIKKPANQISMIFSAAYALFFFACLLFFVMPGQNKQLLGYQFYQVPQINGSATIMTLVNRIPFTDYDRNDYIIYHSPANQSYKLARIENIDLANYNITTHSNINVSKDQIMGYVRYSSQDFSNALRTGTLICVFANGFLILRLWKIWQNNQNRSVKKHRRVSYH